MVPASTQLLVRGSWQRASHGKACASVTDGCTHKGLKYQGTPCFRTTRSSGNYSSLKKSNALPRDPALSLSKGITPFMRMESPDLSISSRFHHLSTQLHWESNFNTSFTGNKTYPTMAIYNRKWFSHKKEGNPAIHYNTDELWGCYAKWSRLLTEPLRRCIN